MIRAKAAAALTLGVLTLSACDLFQQAGLAPRPETPRATETPATPATPAAAPAPRPPAAGLQGGGQTVAQLDRSTPAERAAATAAPAATGGKLGDTIASLGNATEPGFWIKTPLVTSAAKGRVVNPATGKSVNLDLQPLGGGGGSQLSLAAMQALGVGLTDLPKVEVWRN